MKGTLNIRGPEVFDTFARALAQDSEWSVLLDDLYSPSSLLSAETQKIKFTTSFEGFCNGLLKTLVAASSEEIERVTLDKDPDFSEGKEPQTLAQFKFAAARLVQMVYALEIGGEIETPELAHPPDLTFSYHVKLTNSDTPLKIGPKIGMKLAYPVHG